MKTFQDFIAEARKKVKVDVKRPIEYKIADIGPGKKEHNVKTSKGWVNEASDADAASQLGWGGGASITRGGDGGRIGKERKKTAPEIRRTKAVGGGKTEPVGPYKTRKDVGQQRGSSAPAPGRGQGSTELKPGTAGTKGSAAMSRKELQRKAYLERKARESGQAQPKTASQAISQAKPAAEKPAAKPRRQWKTETGGAMTRQERDKARNAEITAAAQKTKKSSNEILAQMRKEYEEGGGKWSAAVAVRMRAKAKAAAQASGS